MLILLEVPNKFIINISSPIAKPVGVEESVMLVAPAETVLVTLKLTASALLLPTQDPVLIFLLAEIVHAPSAPVPRSKLEEACAPVLFPVVSPLVVVWVCVVAPPVPPYADAPLGNVLSRVENPVHPVGVATLNIEINPDEKRKWLL